MPSPYVFTQWFTFGSNGSNAAVDNLAAVDNMFTPESTQQRQFYVNLRRIRHLRKFSLFSQKKSALQFTRTLLYPYSLNIPICLWNSFISSTFLVCQDEYLMYLVSCVLTVVLNICNCLGWWWGLDILVNDNGDLIVCTLTKV